MASSSSFVHLLASQGSIDLDPSSPVSFTSHCPEEPSVKERRKWTPKEDKILISAWLNTSKDAVTSNAQKAAAFWKRIVEYCNSSPLLVGTVPRELGQCKQRWARINDLVGKFCGCYETALRDLRSGQNENTVMSVALDIFENDQGFKFNLEHAWRELRYDVKWCSTCLEKETGKEKRKPVAEAEERPEGVKAAKAGSKKPKNGKEEEISKIAGLLSMKNQISRQNLLESLLAKLEPLDEMEQALKIKLMSEMI